MTKRTKEEEDELIITGKMKVSPSKRFHTLLLYCSDAVYENLKGMEYQQFLTSNYWWIVRGYKLFLEDYKCCLCDSDYRLNVHHKNYEHRGEEHNYLKDLVVLCKSCHEKFHDIIKD